MSTTEQKKKKLLYLHGFNSAGTNSFKIQLLEEKGYEVLYPTINYDNGFEATKNQIKKIIKENKIKHIVGTSLGGWWALYIANYIFKGNVKALAINSPLHPGMSKSLEPGKKVNFITGKEYDWTLAFNKEYNKITKPKEFYLVTESYNFLSACTKHSNCYLSYNLDDEVVIKEKSILYNMVEFIKPVNSEHQKEFIARVYKNIPNINYGVCLAVFENGGHRANNFNEIINCERLKKFFE